MALLQTNRMGWDPFSEIRRLQSDMNRLFDGARTPAVARGFPPINLWVGDNSVVVTTELPGLNQGDIELTVHRDTLAIRGERKLQNTDNEVAWHRRERTHGTFSRTIELPFPIDPETVQARFQNGVLEVEMRRPDEDLPRRIEIKAQ